MKKGKVSVGTAISLNLHILLGGGFFIAAQEMKGFGFLFSCSMWILGAIIFLPLTKIFADLGSRFPVAGGLYAYPREAFNNTFAIVSGLVFFVAVAFGNAALVKYFYIMLAQTFPVVTSQPFLHIALQFLIILIVAILSIQGSKALHYVENIVSMAKILSILLVFIAGLYFFDTSTFLIVPCYSVALKKSLAFIAFAYIGVEACCAIAHQVENISLVTYLSLALSALFYVILQAMICFLGINFGSTNTAGMTFLAGLSNTGFLNTVMFSYFGSIYGGFLSNNWNLYAIAKDLDILKGHDKAMFYLCAMIQVVIMGLGIFATNVLMYSLLATTAVYAVVIASYVKLFWNERPFIPAALSAVAIAIMAWGCIVGLDGSSYF